MMILYLCLLLILVLARVYVVRRVARLEKKYARAAQAARELLQQPVYKGGNNNRTDACAHAKQQYLLGEVTARRDQAESRYLTWQARSDKLARLISRIRSWKGRMVPYLAGIVDVALVLVLLSVLGVIEFPTLTKAVEELLARREG
jgi:hypothetical protein